MPKGKKGPRPEMKVTAESGITVIEENFLDDPTAGRGTRHMKAKRTVKAWAIVAGVKRRNFIGASWFMPRPHELCPPQSCAAVFTTRDKAKAALKDSSIHRWSNDPVNDPHLFRPRVVRVEVTMKEA